MEELKYLLREMGKNIIAAEHFLRVCEPHRCTTMSPPSCHERNAVMSV